MYNVFEYAEKNISLSIILYKEELSICDKFIYIHACLQNCTPQSVRLIKLHITYSIFSNFIYNVIPSSGKIYFSPWNEWDLSYLREY